jgi:hypothetical protein
MNSEIAKVTEIPSDHLVEQSLAAGSTILDGSSTIKADHVF